MTTPDPIATAREALIDIRTARNFGHNTAAEAITAALDYAESLRVTTGRLRVAEELADTKALRLDDEQRQIAKALGLEYDDTDTPDWLTAIEKLKSALEVTQDEGLTEIARLTSQLEQAMAFIQQVTSHLPDKDVHGWGADPYDPDPPLVMANPRKAASQWIKDRQAKAGGIVSMDTPSPVQPDPTCAKNAQVQIVKPVLEWQDIATSPKDGTPFLAYWLRRYSDGVRYESMQPQHVCYWHEGKLFPVWIDADDLPTHWMPLPVPPLSIGDK